MSSQSSGAEGNSSPCFRRTPESVLWIVGGNRENESLIPLFSGLVEQSPWECKNKLITNCLNYRSFPGETYLSKNIDGKDTLLGKYRALVLNALDEDMLMDADIIVTGSMTAAVLTVLLDLKDGRYRERPVVYVAPKIPELGVGELAIGSGNEKLFWWMVGMMGNLHAVVLDNDTEKILADERLSFNYPNTNKSIKKVVTYKHDKIIHTSKENRVVWSGRYNSVKNPQRALKIMALLEGLEVKCSLFIVSADVGKKTEIKFAQKICESVHINLPTDEYIKAAMSAKILLITSEVEGFPLGYIELLRYGAVPVIKKKPWMKTFLTAKWPLVYDTDGEAVEMCRDALRNHDHYIGLLDSCLRERYSNELNWGDVLGSIWRRYVATDRRHDYSVGGEQYRTR